MARLVEEIMNRELFTARPEESAADLTAYFATLGIGASPVLGSSGELLGMISLRDLVRARDDDRIDARMHSPVATVAAKATIDTAAKLMGETGFHRLPVVDGEGRVVGIVSSLDVVRGLVGVPARHPETLPHRDEDTGVVWTDDTPLELDRVEAAADGPGVIALVHGGAGVRERVVWAEMTQNMRTRLIDMLSTPQDQYPLLRYWLDRQPLRFRSAGLMNRDEAAAVVDKLQRRAGYARV